MTEGMIITYETLFDLLRREKARDELQELDPEFYKNVHSYVQEKYKLLTADTHGFMDESEKTRIQIANIKKIVKELYERRERKVVNLALFKSRVNNKVLDTRALLPEEHILFESILGQLSENRSVVLTTLLNNVAQSRKVEFMENIPPPPIDAHPEEGENTNDLQENHQQTYREKYQEKYKENRQEMHQENHQMGHHEEFEEQPTNESMEEPLPEELAQEDPKKQVRFTNAVPKFLGTELEVYGPFEEQDVAQLPSKIADVLISKGRAQEIAR